MASLGTDVEALVEDRLNSSIHNEGKTHLWQETVEDVVVGSDGSGGGGGGGGGGAGSGACQLGQLQLNRWVVLAHLAPSPTPPCLHLGRRRGAEPTWATQCSQLCQAQATKGCWVRLLELLELLHLPGHAWVEYPGYKLG